MARGTSAVPLQVPVQGLVANKPLVTVPNTASAAAINLFVDIDGFMKPRPGYVQLVPVPGSFAIGEAVSGIAGVTGSQNVFSYVTAFRTAWGNFTPGSLIQTNITGPVPFNGTATDPTRFATFIVASNTGTDQAVLGVNNVDTLRSWTVGDAATTIQANAPGARDIAIISGRVVVINTLEAGFRNLFRARWCGVNDVTNWPAAAFNDMTDTDQELVAIRAIGRSAAAIYSTNSIWLMTAQPRGLDALAFSFDTVPNCPVGPVSTQAVVVAEGYHWYFGSDFRIWQFDGYKSVPISQTIDPVLQPDVVSSGIRSIHGVYVQALRQIWWWYPGGQLSTPQTGPQNAVCMNLIGDQGPHFEGLMTFAEPFSTSALVEDGRTSTNTIHEFMVYLGSVAGVVHQFDHMAPVQQHSDNGTAIAYTWSSPLYTKMPDQQILAQSLDLFLQQAAQSETITVVVQGMNSPQATPTPIVTFTIDISQSAQFDNPIQATAISQTQTLPNGTTAVYANTDTYFNYHQIVITGSTTKGGFAFGGGLEYVNTEKRPN